MSYDEAAKGPVALDAIYFLDYKGGRLLATVPSYRQTTTATRVLESFSDVTWSPTSSSNWTSGLVPASYDHWLHRPRKRRLGPSLRFRDHDQPGGVYRMLMQTTIGDSARPRFELLEMRSFDKGVEAGRRP